MLHKFPILALAFLLIFPSLLHSQVRTSGWVSTFSWHGNGIGQTDIFTLAKGEWRIRCRPHGRGPFIVTLHDADNGNSRRLTRQTGSNPVSGTFKGSDAIKSAYLMVHGGDDGWQITVEHYMDTIEEWNFRQSLPPPRPLDRFGSWTGEANEQIVAVDIVAPSWRLSHAQLGAGRLRLDVFAEDGNCVASACTAIGGLRETWVHASGTFTIRVSTIDTPWLFHIDIPRQQTATVTP